MSKFVKIIWSVFGGIAMGIAWWTAGIIMYLTVVGIPYGRVCFVITGVSLSPSGKSIVRRRDLTDENTQSTRALQLAGNTGWFLLCGWWLLLGHLLSSVTLVLFTFRISLAARHITLAKVALSPGETTIVEDHIARAIKERSDTSQLHSAHNQGQ